MTWHPWIGKGLALGAVGIGLVVGLGMLAGVVSDRVDYRQEAARSVTQSLAGAQTLMGPVLAMSCTETWPVVSTRADAAQMTGGADGLLRRTERATAWVMVPPDNLVVNGKADMQSLKRSIYSVNTYNLDTQIKAEWSNAALTEPKPRNVGGTVQCETPVVFVTVSDSRGLRSAQISLNDKPARVLPGTTNKAHANGFHAALPQLLGATAPLPLVANIALDVLGTQQLALVPIASDNQFQISSSWPHPSFGGSFLPTDRRVADAGFEATWRLSALATNAQQQLKDGKDPDEVNVAFIEPVDAYVLSDRAIKYGVLFIFLTFVAVGMVELLKRVRVHPIQYALVGAALCSFFLLLLSLSEHVPFAWAYAAAGAGCVALLTYYASFILGNWRLGLPFGAMMAVMYGLLYVLLRLEQTALVVGALSLFGALTVIMVATRKVNWYGMTEAQVSARDHEDSDMHMW